MTDPGSILSVIAENPELENALYGNEEIATFVTFAVPVLVLLSYLFNVFIGYPVLVGMNRFFMENRISGSKIERIFWVFKSGNYFNVVKTMFLMNLKVFLWSLLLLIPGIIKSYQYYMVPYILAENPGISSKRAFEISKKMTDGEKFDIFWLGLSFFGWILLGTLACGIGVLFVEPYIQTTFAELYQVMREKAHERNISDYNELPGFFPEQN
ncbi:MAG: DUF975 family protein [Oscillospiraceae bacterium]|nr:DUF975 family protein [Oscillospiraceae bacterium]MBR3963299.1 DUF975 family protein [Oscillospiraceae bacterium]